MLTSFCWVPKGGMKAMPILSTDTVDQARDKLRHQDPDFADEEAEGHTNGENGNENATDTHPAQRRRGTKQGKAAATTTTTRGAAEEAESEGHDEDVNDTLRDIAGGGAGAILEQVESEDDEELEDICFKETDLVFSVTVAETKAPRVELYTYDEPADSLFLHHDMEIAAFPLASAWLTDRTMSMLAVGTMLPFIEIWALDVMDSVEPAFVLGGCTTREMNYAKSKKLRQQHLLPSSHTDAVLALRWNTVAQHILASGSADKTIKLWDLNAAVSHTQSTTTSTNSVGEACLGTYVEPEKVQTLDWHPREANLLLSGGFDHSVVLRDCRTPQQAALRFTTDAIVEHVEFDHFTPTVLASTNAGTWACYDLRSAAANGTNAAPAPLWQLQHVHDAETTFSCSRHVSGLYATGGKDGQITLWDGRQMTQAGSGAGAMGPRRLVSRDYKTGAVLSLAFHPNSPHILGACGTRGEPLVYTMSEDIKNEFAQ